MEATERDQNSNLRKTSKVTEEREHEQDSDERNTERSVVREKRNRVVARQY